MAPFTADADLSIDPARLGPDPRIAEAMTKAGFTLKTKGGNGGIEPGTWLTSAKIDNKMVHPRRPPRPRSARARPGQTRRPAA